MSFKGNDPPTPFMPLNNDIWQKAFTFIAEKLGGKGNYISAHIRRGDFRNDCSQIPTNNCALNMTNVARVIANAVRDRNISTVFIATNGEYGEINDAIDDIKQFSGRDVSVYVGTKRGFKPEAADDFEEIALEQQLLGCGQIMFWSPGSTFGSIAHELGAVVGCNPILKPLPVS